MADEDVRLAHYAAEDAARKAMLRAPSSQPAVPGHEDEVLSKHLGRPVKPANFSVAGEAYL